MDADWIVPIATVVPGLVGVVFTWLAGFQGRRHTERMVDRTRSDEAVVRREQERREAYLDLLRFHHITLRRTRYKRMGAVEKLGKVDERWSKADLVNMGMEAFIGLQAFGSDRVIHLADQWTEAWEVGDQERAEEVADQLQRCIRQELRSSEAL